MSGRSLGPHICKSFGAMHPSLWIGGMRLEEGKGGISFWASSHTWSDRLFALCCPRFLARYDAVDSPYINAIMNAEPPVRSSCSCLQAGSRPPSSSIVEYVDMWISSKKKKIKSVIREPSRHHCYYT